MLILPTGTSTRRIKSHRNTKMM